MSIPGSANPLLLKQAATAGGYQIERSLRFNSSDSAYLSRTPASSGNRKTWTWAGWVKKSRNGASYEYIFDGAATANFGFLSDSFYFYDNAVGVNYRVSTQVFRDPSAWYHFVVAFDSDNATAQNRLRMYVNGSEITAWSTNNTVALSAVTQINNNAQHCLGGIVGYAYSSTLLADIHFIDGQALTPSSFTEVSATTGQLVPKAYTGSYGTNGFRLKFADNSNNTATTLGADTSGNGNNWTPNNLSVTAGAGNDSLVDTPTSYGTDTGAGGEVRGNYCTLNAVDSARTLSNGNLEYAGASSGISKGTIGVSSGKWYWECQRQGAANSGFGVCTIDTSSAATYLGSTAGAYAYSSAALKYNNDSSASYGATYTSSDIIGVALDLDAGTLVFYKNGVSQGTAYSGLSGTFVPACGNNSTTDSGIFNFGQRPFAYAAPSGFKALCDTNLPAPVVAKPNEVMDVALWTGNGSARSITGLAFNPDLVWIKGRSGATDHALYDVVRGVQKDLVSNSTAAETTQAQGVTAFNSDGFSLGTLAKLNTNAATYAGWAWDAGSTTVTNTQGSISSQVRANASSGFSVVTYTGTGANATVGHGLGVAPGLVIVKRRNSTGNWQVRHTSIAAASSIQLNLTNAAASATTVWNSTAPSSTVFSVGTDATVNASGATYVAYCFAPLAGYSSFGSYTGNGSADGPFVFTGMRSRWLMVRCSSSSGDWVIFDTDRSGFNLTDKRLFPNSSAAESTSADRGLDITSNGFKVRATHVSVNTSGATYIYAAFAEHPFAYARAR